MIELIIQLRLKLLCTLSDTSKHLINYSSFATRAVVFSLLSVQWRLPRTICELLLPPPSKIFSRLLIIKVEKHLQHFLPIYARDKHKWTAVGIEIDWVNGVLFLSPGNEKSIAAVDDRHLTRAVHFIIAWKLSPVFAFFPLSTSTAWILKRPGRIL